MAIKPPDPANVWRYSATDIDGKHRLPQKPKINHFTRLPAELRNRIYELVLVDTTKPQQIHSLKVKDPALLRTCRQIRLEARGIYYCLNIFHLAVSVNNLECLRQWLHYIKETCGKMITGRICVKNATWEDIGKLLPLMQIANDGMKVTKVDTDFSAKSSMLGILRSVASLGERASVQEWEMGEVEIAFDEWMLGILQGSVWRGLNLLSNECVNPGLILRTFREAFEAHFGDPQKDSPEPPDRNEDDSSEYQIAGRSHSSGWTVVN